MRRRGMADWKAGAITLAVAVVVVVLGFTKANPFASPFELKAAFTDAGMVKPGAKVRVAGVDVGKVEGVEALGDGSRGAVVTMSIQDEGLPVHRDARLKVRPRIFLEGNYFVDLQPGSPSAPELGDGDVVPATQTAAPVGIGQVLETFQKDTRESLQTLLAELGRGFAGGGAEGLNGAIRWWAPAFRDSAIVSEAARGTTGRDLSGYVASAGAVAQALDRDPAALQGLITDFATTADALASQQDRLRSGVGQLDETLAVGRSALAEVSRALPALRTLVTELRPAARAARPALDAQLPLVRELRALTSASELRGLVRELRPVVPDLVELAEGGVALQEQARLLASCQVGSVLPTSRARIEDRVLPAKGMVYEEFLKSLPGLAGESRSFDANGQYTKTLAQSASYAYLLPGGRFFPTTAPLQQINPPKAPGIPPTRNDVPCETQDRPDLRTVPQAPPPMVKVDQTSKAALGRREKSVARAVRALRAQLKLEGLSRKLRVTERPLTKVARP